VYPFDPGRIDDTAAETVDLAVIGAGAAGLATTIFAARQAPRLRIRALDGARHPGAKILISGGSRCNVTNRIVNERDFCGGPSRVVRSVLRAFPAPHAVAFFTDLGVALHEEEDGKLFPDSNRSRTVLDALLAEVQARGAAIDAGARVCAVARDGGRFAIEVQGGRIYAARRVVLATGGRSLPKTGSDGFGYELARRLGHGHVETTPALAPLRLHGDRHAALSGISHRVSLALRVGGRLRRRLEGSLLWTHFGASGPVALDMSRHWHRARLAGQDVEVTVGVCPGETFESLEAWWQEQQLARPRARVATLLATRLPSAVADAWTASAAIDPETTAAHLSRDDRRRLVRALIETTLAVEDSRGYGYAEATAGGVPLDEVDAATLESRICPGLHLVGEILDVDGRLGGFNFQWAWASGCVAGRAAARALAEHDAAD
jgi:predicted Rossmann fold flavoprotein